MQKSAQISNKPTFGKGRPATFRAKTQFRM